MSTQQKVGTGKMKCPAAGTALLPPLLCLASALANAATESPCLGTPTTPPGAVIYPPVIPQPSEPTDIVGIIVQNTDSRVSASRILTLGQVFIAGQVQPGDNLIAKFNGTTTPVQMDALANWPDGSVKLASLAVQVPSLCAKGDTPAMIAKAAIPPARRAPLRLTTAPPPLSVTLDFTAGSYNGSRTIDLGAALQTTLATQPDYWLRGPLVTQARVDVPLSNEQSATTATLHLTADVSLFADGSALADVQFNNDLTTVLPKTGKINPQPALPALDYTATIHFQGKALSHTVSQVQYTAWRATLWSHTLPTPAPTLNIQHDIPYLIKTGAILPYDLTTGVNHSLLQSYESKLLQKPDFGQPLAGNGITHYMPTTGGRPDIGFTTQYNTVWLLTQDARAAKVALAQSDTAGAIPWNYKLANGRWLTPGDVTDIWTDSRGGPHGYSSGVANVASHKVWSPDTAHQPNLNYIPTLMTANRWHYDRQLAQAAYNLATAWPGGRCKTPKCNTIIGNGGQVRGQAWSLRELKQAAFIAKEDSPEQRYLNQTMADNWAYLKTQQPLWAAKQGEATGWLPGAYGNKGATAEWQQDFFTVIAAMAAFMGDGDAGEFVAWQTPWLSGRFIGNGMNPYDGCNYNLMVADKTSGEHLNTWSAIASATQAAGLSNGATWKGSGYYCALARSALSTAILLNPNQPALAAALTWLTNANAPSTNPDSFRADPTFNLRLPPSHTAAETQRHTPPNTKSDNLPPYPVWLGTVQRIQDGQLGITPDSPQP